jgi:hypothetical protein
LLETGVELLDGHLGCRQRPYVMRRRRPPRRVGARRTVLEYFFLLTTTSKCVRARTSKNCNFKSSKLPTICLCLIT